MERRCIDSLFDEPRMLRACAWQKMWLPNKGTGEMNTQQINMLQTWSQIKDLRFTKDFMLLTQKHQMNPVCKRENIIKDYVLLRNSIKKSLLFRDQIIEV